MKLHLTFDIVILRYVCIFTEQSGALAYLDISELLDVHLVILPPEYCLDMTRFETLKV